MSQIIAVSVESSPMESSSPSAWLPSQPMLIRLEAQSVVQLPTFHFFSVSTSVSVPDGGDAFLGGVGTVSSARTERGIPGFIGQPFTNIATGSTIGAASASVHAEIHDFEALDQRSWRWLPTNIRLVRLPMFDVRLCLSPCKASPRFDLKWPPKMQRKNMKRPTIWPMPANCWPQAKPVWRKFTYGMLCENLPIAAMFINKPFSRCAVSSNQKRLLRSPVNNRFLSAPLSVLRG